MGGFRIGRGWGFGRVFCYSRCLRAFQGFGECAVRDFRILGFDVQVVRLEGCMEGVGFRVFFRYIGLISSVLGTCDMRHSDN